MKPLLELNQCHVHRGFLVRNDYDSPARGRALDAYRRPRGEEEEDPEEDNIIPMSQEPEGYERAYAKDDEDPDEEGREGEVIARYPADQVHFATEGDEVVVYRGAGETARYESDRHTFDTRDHRPSRPPQTLRELNALNAAHYRKAGRR